MTNTSNETMTDTIAGLLTRLQALHSLQSIKPKKIRMNSAYWADIKRQAEASAAWLPAPAAGAVPHLLGLPVEIDDSVPSYVIEEIAP